MWFPSPRSVVTLCYRGMIQYLVIAVAGEFPSLGKENGFQGFLSLRTGLLDLCLKDEVSKFPVPSITAAKTFPNLQLMEIVLILQEIVLILQPPVFLASEFHCPCSGLCAWQTWCISHFLSKESTRDARQWCLQWQHTVWGGKVISLEFYKYLQSFLSSQNGSQGQGCSPLRATRRGAAPGWHPKLRQFGFNPGRLFIGSWEAQLGEVLRGFLPCKGSTSQPHITNRWLFNSFPHKQPVQEVLFPLKWVAISTRS